MADTRRKFTKEFKLQAVGMLEDGEKSGQQIEKELGIGAGQAHRWRREFEADGDRAFPGNGKNRDEELVQLRKENKDLREQRESG